MSEYEVKCIFEGTSSVILQDGKLCVYGPLNYNGNYTSESNEKFDKWLSKRDAKSGIKDFEWINSLTESYGFKLLSDHEMPANNRLLEFLNDE